MINGLMPNYFGTGDPVKPKKKYDSGAEMRQLYNKPMKYDNNRPAFDLVKQASRFTNINPSLLFSSSFTEGMNKAIADPDSVSEAYNNAKVSGDYPVDGFFNYGLDTFGSKIDKLKQYLPEGFDQRYKVYDAINEKGEPIRTAAFKTNQDALTAKAAMLKNEMATVEGYAKQKGIDLDEKAKDYFTLASYNGGFGNARIMMDEYAKAKDKAGFIDNGLTTRKEYIKTFHNG